MGSGNGIFAKINVLMKENEELKNENKKLKEENEQLQELKLQLLIDNEKKERLLVDVITDLLKINKIEK